MDEDGMQATEGAAAPFDYRILDEAKRARVQIKAEAIKLRMKRTAEEIIAIGQDLLEVKRELGHGLFQHWLQAEFEMSESAATKFMQVATRFGEDSKSVKITNLPATVLYFLAAPSTPHEIVEQVLAGEIPADAKAIRDAKVAQQRAEEELAEAKRARSVGDARMVQMNYEQEVLRQEVQSLQQERDRLKRDVEGGLEAYYAQKLELKAENTFLALLSHGTRLFSETQQYIDHVVSAGMLREVRRLGENRQERFRIFLAQLRSTYHALAEAEIKLTSPSSGEGGIVDEDARPKPPLDEGGLGRPLDQR